MGIVFGLVDFFVSPPLFILYSLRGGPLYIPCILRSAPGYSFFLISIYSLRFTYPKKIE